MIFAQIRWRIALLIQALSNKEFELRLMTNKEKKLVFSHEKEDSVKNNLVIVKTFLPFIRGLTAENTNSQISQNRVRLYTFNIALNTSKSLPDLK